MLLGTTLQNGGINPSFFAAKLHRGTVSSRRVLRYNISNSFSRLDEILTQSECSPPPCVLLRQICERGVLTPYLLRTSYREEPCREGDLCDAFSRFLWTKMHEILIRSKGSTPPCVAWANSAKEGC